MNNRKKILKLAMEKGFLFDKETLDMLDELPNPENALTSIKYTLIKKECEERVITLKILNEIGILQYG